MNKPRWVERGDAASLATAVADYLAERLSAVLGAGRPGSLVVPGGRTAAPVLQSLAQRALPWESLSVMPGDERVVETTHAASNFGVVLRSLGRTPARLVSLLDQSQLADRDALLRAAEQRVASIAAPFDVVWVGMGTDGHIASLFPGQPLSGSGSGRVLAALPDPLPPEAPYPRLSLTLSALLDSRELVLVITGSSKRTVVEVALSEGAASSYPVGRLLAAATQPVTLFWSESA